MSYHYPECRTVSRTENWHGIPLPDPYSWLQNAMDPEVLDFVARENAFTDQYFDPEKLKKKITVLKESKLPDLPAGIHPWKDGYITNQIVDGIPRIRLLDKKMRPTGDLPEITALKEKEGLLIYEVSPCPGNNAILAMLTMYPGAPRPSLLVCDVDQDQLLFETDGSFSYVWSRADNRLYYSTTQADPVTQQSQSSFYAYDPSSDQVSLLFSDDQYSVFGQVFSSRDGRSILAMICQDYSLARWHVIDTVSGKISILSSQAVEWKYLDSQSDRHIFVSVSDAPKGTVIGIRGDGTRETILPESSLVLDNGFSCKGKLFVMASEDASPRIISVETKEPISFPDLYYDAALIGEDSDGSVFLKYESFTSAPQILRFDGKDSCSVMKNSDTSYPDIITEKFFAPSAADGTRIPYYMVRKKDALPNRNNPVLMYAYGGYNISSPPWHKEMVTGIVIADWVEKGGIYVHCALRGGNEYGPLWHEDGMLMKKRHCYEDFIGIAEDLIRKEWTRAGRIGISGCSNGGLLMSALVTMRPDLWGCVIDSVPHTDMIHFCEDDRGPMYITEYGNPRESREMFEYLLSYSPYHNVKKTSYPPVYIQTGELDNNVPPYHGKKFAARMQAETTGEAPILLRVLPEGSHDRGQGEAFWKTISEMQLFLEEWILEERTC